MDIKTEFDRGDMVFYMNNNVIRHEEIERVKTETVLFHEDKTEVNYYVPFDDGYSWIEEKLVFATVNDLIAKLIQLICVVPKGLEDDQVDDYMDDPNSCPICGGEVSADAFDVDGIIGHTIVTCNDCKSEWKDIYQLVGIEDFKKGDKA